MCYKSRQPWNLPLAEISATILLWYTGPPILHLGALMAIFYVALGSSMSLACLVLGRWWSVKAGFILFGNVSSLG